MLLYVFAWKGNDIEFNIIEFEGNMIKNEE